MELIWDRSELIIFFVEPKNESHLNAKVAPDTFKMTCLDQFAVPCNQSVIGPLPVRP